jgi:hypothetical protein
MCRREWTSNILFLSFYILVILILRNQPFFGWIELGYVGCRRIKKDVRCADVSGHLTSFFILLHLGHPNSKESTLLRLD